MTRKRGIAQVYDLLELALRKSLFSISPLLLVEYRSLKLRGKFYNPRSPRTFDEKLLWLMLYWRHPLKTRCADKYAVRSYVAENGLGHLLPDFYGVYDRSSDVDFSRLPGRFVVKCTHGSRFNLYCWDRSVFDEGTARRKLDQWMKKDISKLCGEIHYAMIKPRIMCEAYLGDSYGNLPTDYKVYCFDGKAHCTMVCTERRGGAALYDFYDREWRQKLPYSHSSLLADRSIPRPETYERMISAAEILSKAFPFVRVDFYAIERRLYFGEMTFTPNACIDTGYTHFAEESLGNLLHLPEKRAFQGR